MQKHRKKKKEKRTEQNRRKTKDIEQKEEKHIFPQMSGERDQRRRT